MSQAISRSTVRRAPVRSAASAPGVTTNVASPAARALLAEIVARLSHADLPIVQIMAACGLSRAAGVALGLAVASVSGHGRTLLVTDDGARGSDAGGPRLPGKDAHAVIPDAAVSGLYHRQFDETLLDQEPMPAQTARASAKAFRMLVLASRSPTESPSGLAHAARCHGTILAVAAGVTRFADVQATARQIQLAGGTVLGTVLYDAPRFRLWPS